MKTITGQISIKQGNKEAYSNSESNFKHIKTNSSIRIGDSEDFYTIKKIEPVFYVKPFSGQQKQIKLNEDIGVGITYGDQLVLSFKEYQLLTVVKVSSKGRNYAAGDIVSIKGGNAVVDAVTGEKQAPRLKVEKVNDAGGILKLKIEEKGKYLKTPEKACDVISLAKNGRGCVLIVEYKLTDERKIIERLVTQKTINDGETFLTLNYPIPENVTQGKLSIHKWKLILDSPFKDKTQINAPFEILKDLTPELGLPLLAQGSISTEKIFNLAMRQLSKKIKALEKRILDLES